MNTIMCSINVIMLLLYFLIIIIIILCMYVCIYIYIHIYIRIILSSGQLESRLRELKEKRKDVGGGLRLAS